MSSKKDMDIRIRPFGPEDLSALPYLDWSSDQLFHSCGMSELAEQPMYPPDQYRSIVEDGHVWIATIPREDNSPVKESTEAAEEQPLSVGSSERLVAFVAVRILDSVADVQPETNPKARSGYITQLSVHNQYLRRGIGSALMRHAEAWQRHAGLQYIYLTTYADVPFNRPFYERLGYRVLNNDELNQPDATFVRQHLEDERKHELLGKWERVAMRKSLVD